MSVVNNVENMILKQHLSALLEQLKAFKSKELLKNLDKLRSLSFKTYLEYCKTSGLIPVLIGEKDEVTYRDWAKKQEEKENGGDMVFVNTQENNDLLVGNENKCS